MENNGGICDTMEDMKELASQEAHRYAPLWTGRYHDRTIARSCNNETQFRRGHLSPKMKTGPVSDFAQGKMPIHALRDYESMKKRLLAGLIGNAGASRKSDVGRSDHQNGLGSS